MISEECSDTVVGLDNVGQLVNWSAVFVEAIFNL